MCVINCGYHGNSYSFQHSEKVLFSTGCARLCDVQQLNPFSVVDLLKHISSPACQVRGAAEVNFWAPFQTWQADYVWSGQFDLESSGSSLLITHWSFRCPCHVNSPLYVTIKERSWNTKQTISWISSRENSKAISLMINHRSCYGQCFFPFLFFNDWHHRYWREKLCFFSRIEKSW